MTSEKAVEQLRPPLESGKPTVKREIIQDFFKRPLIIPPSKAIEALKETLIASRRDSIGFIKEDAGVGVVMERKALCQYANEDGTVCQLQLNNCEFWEEGDICTIN